MLSVFFYLQFIIREFVENHDIGLQRVAESQSEEKVKGFRGSLVKRAGDL